MLLGGRPLIAYPIEAALRSRGLSEVIVSTEDEEIAKVARGEGARVVMRPPELAQADSPIDDSFRHVLDDVTRGGVSVDVVVCMQGNVPLHKEGEIGQALGKLQANPAATAAASAYRIWERPEWMKKLRDVATMEIEPLMAAEARFRMQDLPTLYLLDGGFIAIRSDTLRRTAGVRRAHAYMGDRLLIVEHHRKYAVEIDDAEDVDMAEYFLREKETQEHA